MAAEPFRSLEKYSTKYDRLRAMFTTWHGIAKTLPAFGTPPLLSSMVVGDVDPDEPEFSVEHAGTAMFIRLVFRPGSEHGDNGQLVPYSFDPITDDLATFPLLKFNANGGTALHFEGSGDPVVLDEQAGAFHVLGLLVKTVLERK